MNLAKFPFLLLFSLVMTSTYAQIKPPIKPGPTIPIKPGPSLPSQPINECALLSAALKKQSKGEGPCCYQVVLNNRLSASARIFPAAFQVSIKNGNITNVYGTASTWQQTPSTVPTKTKKVIWKQGVKIPSGLSNLATICLEGKNPIWVYQTWFDRKGKVLCQDSIKVEGCINEPTDLCDNPLIRNSGFSPGNTRPPTASPWTVGYGNPQFLNTPNEGCFDPGYVQASGNQSSGDAIAQALLPLNSIRRGRKYVLNVGVRFFAKSNVLDYARISAIAFNGVLPKTGSHPALGPNLALIGRSGKIRDCGDWSVIEFPVWVANKDFQNLALQVFTNDGNTSQLWIDNVYLCETTEGSDCDEVALDASGKPIMPAGYGTVPAGFTCVAEEEEDTYNNGSLQDLYGQLYGYNGTTNWYAQATEKCFSIGGTLPPEVVNYNCDDSLKLAGINMTCDELAKALQDVTSLDTFTVVKPAFLPPIGLISQTCQENPLPTDFATTAFGGKDIIYIHGLELGHLVSRAVPPIDPGALANWPDDQQEFYSGFYKTAAVKAWDDHIDYFTKNKYHNRYLVVAYNCSQRLDVAIHSVLTQIREAMETGRGVRTSSNDPRGTACFGRSFVIISQSTGAIIADVTMAIANNTKTDPVLAAKYGNLGLIADRCKGHIARRGAFTGSNLASLLVALSSASPTPSIIATGLLLQDGGTFVDFANPNNYSIIRSSILVDLIPAITRDKWAPYFDQVPMPVLTVSGGHPTFLSQKEFIGGSAVSTVMAPGLFQTGAMALKYLVHPGFDDGVITTDCAAGRKNNLFNLSTFQASSRNKVFDMGLTTARAVSYFLDQSRPNLNGAFASGATPYLSPSGMVQPVTSVSMNTSYQKHFTFIQAAAEHWIKKDQLCCEYNTTAIGGSKNNEEQLVVSNLALFQAGGIIDPSINSEMGEEIKGRYFMVPYIKMRWAKGIYRPFIFWKRYYIWKRTYHKMRNDGLFDCDYVYRYTFKN